MTFLGGGRACIGFKFSQLEMSEWCPSSVPRDRANSSDFTEVVLCALLDKFKFTPAQEKQIEWKLTNIVTATVVGEIGPKLPLVVSFAD